MIRNLFLFFFLTIASFGTTEAQIITDRPDQTESSSTIPKGGLQIESGILVGYTGEDASSTRQILMPTNLFRYGLTAGIELRILNQLETRKVDGKNLDGIGDLEIGTKIQIFKHENSNTEIAFLTHLVIPTGTHTLSKDNYGTINKVSISHALSDNIGIGYNLGYNYFGDNNGDLSYSLALGVGVDDKVGIYIEPYGELVNLEDFILNFDAGLSYLANANTQLDLSFGAGINNRMNYISIGCSWLIPKK